MVEKLIPSRGGRSFMFKWDQHTGDISKCNSIA